MRWLLSEYVFKGIYIGLLLYVALQEPDWQATGRVAMFTLGGLLLALGAAAVQKLRQGYRIQGRGLAFLLFLLLESPKLVYGGIIVGLAFGALAVSKPERETMLGSATAGGAALGFTLYLLRHVTRRVFRLGLSLALAAALVGGAVFWFYQSAEILQEPAGRAMFGIHLLLGMPLFYLLTFAGSAEETEVEIAIMCAALGFGVWLLLGDQGKIGSLAFLMVLIVYFFYTTRVLPHLRVFKHVVRGISHANVGQHRLALGAFRRALQLDPKNSLAREGLWGLHRSLDLEQLKQDPQTLALVDIDLCLERISSLLLQAGPTSARLEEAHHLLDLVLSQRPALRPVVDYWRAVAHTHARLYDRAATDLERVLDPATFPPNDPPRNSVLLQAWQLAVILHPELNRRVGAPQLAIPGQRLDAIAAVERHLAANPEDGGGWELKRILYGDLTEADYDSAAAGRVAADFDYSYTLQLGLALIGDAARWQRGAEYLRLAARGLPAQAPTILLQIAQAHQKAGQAEGFWKYQELAKCAGRAVGLKNLTPEDKQAYFTTVKLLGDEARSRDDVEAAIENYHLYSDYERAGLETLRILADLNEQKGDVTNALLVTEHALIYNPKDKDLLERKERYYYSLMPEQLQRWPESARKGLDTAYCLSKAKTLLDFKEIDLDQLDWAQHLLELTLVCQPTNLCAKVLKARALRRRGEIDQARAMLEDAHSNKPEKFATAADEEAWFLSCKLLGDMYLNELGKPDLAVPCFNDFRKSSKSGADTLYKLGQAYEQLGDRTRAVKCYKNVTAYDNHPLAPEARDALYRLQAD